MIRYFALLYIEGERNQPLFRARLKAPLRLSVGELLPDEFSIFPLVPRPALITYISRSTESRFGYWGVWGITTWTIRVQPAAMREEGTPNTKASVVGSIADLSCP